MSPVPAPGPVLVVGPGLAGTTSVATALRSRLAGQAVLEHADGQRPAVLVLVVSAAAPMARSDARLLASHAGPVVAAVSKIDVHRTWRSVLEANRALLPVRWVGVAAAPVVGPVRVDDLIEAVQAALLEAPSDRAPRPAPGPDPAARIRLQQTLIESVAGVRAACAGLRAELRANAAESTCVEDFVQDSRRKITRVAAEIEAELSGEPCERWPSDLPDQPSLRPAGLERRLATLFGVTFGAGAALTLGRGLADLLPGWDQAVIAGSSVVGLVLGLWVVRARRLLSERAAADRWAVEITAGLRSALEERITARMLAAEVTLLTSAPFGGCPPGRSDILRSRRL